MESRVHRIGSIFSRINGLIRKGHIKPEGIPIWHDVYKAFPPKYEPTLKRRAPDVTVTEIFYKEDALRALIHKAYPQNLGLFYLNDKKEALSEKLVRTCQQFILEGLSEEEAVKKLQTTFDQSVVSKEYQSERSENISLDELLTKIL